MDTKKWLLIPVLVLALVLAACGTGATDQTPIGTSAPGGTSVTTPETTSGAPVGTAAGTAVGTPAGTAVGTAVGTPQTSEQILIRSSDMVGLNIVDQSGAPVSVVDEVLVDQDGALMYVFFDAGEFLGISEVRTLAVPWVMFTMSSELTGATDASGTPAAGTSGTPAAGTSGTPAAGTSGTPAATVDEGQPHLILEATPEELQDMPVFDMSLLGDDVILEVDPSASGTPAAGTSGTPAAGTDSTPAAATTLPVEFNNLIRLSRFNDYDLRNASDEDLGEVEDLVVDGSAGMVDYALVDVGGFLGVGEKTIAVPWQMFTLQTATTTGETDKLILDVPEDTLNNAPAVDVGTVLPQWPEPIDPDWDQDIRTFWQTVG